MQRRQPYYIRRTDKRLAKKLIAKVDKKRAAFQGNLEEESKVAFIHDSKRPQAFFAGFSYEQYIANANIPAGKEQSHLKKFAIEKLFGNRTFAAAKQYENIKAAWSYEIANALKETLSKTIDKDGKLHFRPQHFATNIVNENGKAFVDVIFSQIEITDPEEQAKAGTTTPVASIPGTLAYRYELKPGNKFVFHSATPSNKLLHELCIQPQVELFKSKRTVFANFEEKDLLAKALHAAKKDIRSISLANKAEALFKQMQDDEQNNNIRYIIRQLLENPKQQILVVALKEILITDSLDASFKALLQDFVEACELRRIKREELNKILLDDNRKQLKNDFLGGKEGVVPHFFEQGVENQFKRDFTRDPIYDQNGQLLISPQELKNEFEAYERFTDDDKKNKPHPAQVLLQKKLGITQEQAKGILAAQNQMVLGLLPSILISARNLAEADHDKQTLIIQEPHAYQRKILFYKNQKDEIIVKVSFSSFNIINRATQEVVGVIPGPIETLWKFTTDPQDKSLFGYQVLDVRSNDDLIFDALDDQAITEDKLECYKNPHAVYDSYCAYISSELSRIDREKQKDAVTIKVLENLFYRIMAIGSCPTGQAHYEILNSCLANLLELVQKNRFDDNEFETKLQFIQNNVITLEKKPQISFEIEYGLLDYCADKLDEEKDTLLITQVRDLLTETDRLNHQKEIPTLELAEAMKKTRKLIEVKDQKAEKKVQSKTSNPAVELTKEEAVQAQTSLAKEIGKRSWGKTLCGIMLCTAGVVLLGASVALDMTLVGMPGGIFAKLGAATLFAAGLTALGGGSAFSYLAEQKNKVKKNFANTLGMFTTDKPIEEKPKEEKEIKLVFSKK